MEPTLIQVDLKSTWIDSTSSRLQNFEILLDKNRLQIN